MTPLVFGLFGTGWRADFYRRIAAALPDRFAVGPTYSRTPGRADVTVVDEFFERAMDFAVVSVKRGTAQEALRAAAAHRVPVLMETPPASVAEDLVELWELERSGSLRIQVAEQYFLQPLYAAWLSAARSGLVGEVTSVNLSAVHGYHAASLFRLFLGTGYSPFTVTARRFALPVVNTGSRAGADLTGTLVTAERIRAEFEFAGGKLGLYDFSGQQYHSSIRTRQLTVQGTRGELDDLTARYLGTDNAGIVQTLTRRDSGVWGNRDWSHDGLWLGERALYRNPFPGARLNDDELAVASCLEGMGAYVRTGTPFYPLAEALEDTRLSLALDEATVRPGVPVTPQPGPWSEVSPFFSS